MNKPNEFLRELFEFEYCAECGGDAEHHQEVPTPGIGPPFAVCMYPPSESTDWEWHPVIQAFRKGRNQ